MNTEMNERKEIVKAVNAIGKHAIKGIYANKGSLYGTSYLLFDENGTPISLNGFSARQFTEYLEKVPELEDMEFRIEIVKKHSPTYNKDYAFIKKIVDMSGEPLY